jgi:chemotaxis protein CheZ
MAMLGMALKLPGLAPNFEAQATPRASRAPPSVARSGCLTPCRQAAGRGDRDMQTLEQDGLVDTVRCVVRAEMAELHRFVDRRFAELSAELHCTVSLAEASEDALTAQLGEMRREIGALVSAPVAATRNSGSELEAVVQATETAANRIMEAAEAIAEWAASDQRDPAALTARVNAIFEACTFQDLTGQRLRRAIEHLQSVEAMLDRMVPAELPDQPGPAPDIDQSEIDRLLNG